MADAPERIWTASTEGKCHVGFATPSMNYTNEYIRADLMAELVGLLGRANEELRMLRAKDTGAVYDVTLRLDLAAAIAKLAEGGGLVERLLAVDHMDVEDCFTQSPLFTQAAAHIAALTAERDDARKEAGIQMRHLKVVADKLAPAEAERDALRAKVARLEGALSYYADQYCEGFCQDLPPGYTDENCERDCGGCKARAALAKIKEQTK